MTFNRFMQYWSIIAVGLSIGALIARFIHHDYKGALMFFALCFVNHVGYNMWKKEERNG